MKHHHHLLKKMAEKGWSEEELRHANGVWEAKKHEKHFAINYLDFIIHWIFFVIIVAGNMVVSAVVVPLLVIFPNPGIYAVLLVLGVMFGLLVEQVIKHIDHQLGPHHHFILGIIIPFIAVVSLFLIITYSMGELPNIFDVTRHPWTMGFIYAVAFVLPYAIGKMIDKVHEQR